MASRGHPIRQRKCSARHRIRIALVVSPRLTGRVARLPPLRASQRAPEPGFAAHSGNGFPTTTGAVCLDNGSVYRAQRHTWARAFMILASHGHGSLLGMALQYRHAARRWSRNAILSPVRTGRHRGRARRLAAMARRCCGLARAAALAAAQSRMQRQRGGTMWCGADPPHSGRSQTLRRSARRAICEVRRCLRSIWAAFGSAASTRAFCRAAGSATSSSVRFSGCPAIDSR